MKKSRTIAIIQARMGSSRLPGKVLLDLAGQPMLVRVVERTKRARLLDDVIVATTTEIQDAAVETLCRERGYSLYRGSLHDVLDRYYVAAQTSNAGIIVRITADCPVIDPGLIDATVKVLIENSADFAANRLPPPWKRTYPIGLDVEVCTFAALERAWQEADQAYHREHVLPFIYDGVVPSAVSPQLALGRSARDFTVAVLNHDPDYGNLRWAVDTPEDLELLRRIFANFGCRDDFSWLDILEFWKLHPKLAQINAGIQHKTAFDVEARK